MIAGGVFPPSAGHTPVLVREVTRAFEPFPGGAFVDATAGFGGHSEAVLREVRGIASYIGIDRDATAIESARRRLARFSIPARFHHADFRHLSSLVHAGGSDRIGGILFDLGVSSHQLDTPGRGFSHTFEGDLDMRMDRRERLSAREVVNDYSASRLEEVLRRGGDEKNARVLARAIVRAREKAPITGTNALAAVLVPHLHPRWRRKGLSRLFQAIRIEVNDEIGSLQEALPDAVDLLAPGGRIAVIAYHSIEDRIVKRKFHDWARGCVCPSNLPVCRCGRVPVLRLTPRRAIRPDTQERATNRRSRSARLRVGVRIGPGGVRKEVEN